MKLFSKLSRALATLLSMTLLVGVLPVFTVAAEDPLVFGVLSDVHLTKAETDWERRERFKMALEYYKEQGAKVIVANADINDIGEAEAYDKFMAIWDKVFPDPETAPKLLVTGDNHEWFGAWNFREAGTSANNTTMAVKQQMFMDGLRLTSTNNAVVVDGYHFIAFSTDGFQPNTSCAYYDEETVAWVTEKLAAAAAESNTRPIYVFMHQPPTGTVAQAEVNDQLSELFAQYPQIVMFTSHTHARIEDERNIYQKDFTVVNTSAIYQNAQATIASVSGNTTTVSRIRVKEGEGVTKIKYDWVIENPSDKSGYIYTADLRAEKASAPSFAAGAAVTAIPLGNNRFQVSFPAAQPVDYAPSDYVHQYRITVKKDGVTYTTMTPSSDFSAGLEKMADYLSYIVSMPGNMTVGAEYQISVEALDSYGNASPSIGGIYTHAYKSTAKMVTQTAKFDAEGEVMADGTSTGFSVTVDQDTMPTVDSNGLSWDYHLIGVEGEGGVYLNGVPMDNLILYKSWQNRFKIHLPSAVYNVGDTISIRGWFRPENIDIWPTGYAASWRAYFTESVYEFTGTHWVQRLYDESCGGFGNIPVESVEPSLVEQTGTKPAINTRHHYAVANDPLPVNAELTAALQGVYVDGVLDPSATLWKVGDGRYDICFGTSVEDGTTVTVDGLFSYGGYYLRFEKMSIVYDESADGWHYASAADYPADAPIVDDSATNGELLISDATIKMGGDYGAGAYYELQANFTAANWIVNAIPTAGDITVEYDVNGETRTNATSVFGVTYLAGLGSNYLTPFGGANFIANTGNTTTFYSQKQTPHITLKMDTATYVPTVNGAAVSPHVITEWANYHEGQTVDNSSVAAFFEDLAGYGAQYFGLGWNGGNFSADYAKLMIYDENNNNLGVQSHAIGRENWSAVLKADYGATVYLQPTVKSGFEVAGLSFKDEDGSALDIEATDEGSGIWSFVMTSEIYSVEPVYDTPSTVVDFTLMLPDSQWQPSQNRYLLYFSHDLADTLTFDYGRYDVISIDGIHWSATCSTTAKNTLMIILNSAVGIIEAGEHKVVLRGGTRIGNYKIAQDVVLYTHTAYPTVDQSEPEATEFTVLGLGRHHGAQDGPSRYLAGLDTDVAYVGGQTTLTVGVNGTEQTFSLYRETNTDDGIAQPTLIIPYAICPKGGEYTLTVKKGTTLENKTLTADFVFYIHADGAVDTLPPAKPDAVTLIGSQVTLGDALDVDYSLSVEGTLNASTLSATVTYGTYSETLSLGEADADGYYHLGVSLAAKEMATAITVTVSDAAKTYVSKTHSLREYGEAIINGNYTEAEQTAAKAMLNYGAMAQLYFEYNLSDLANQNCAYTAEELLTADVSEIPLLTVENGLSGYGGATLLLKSKIAVRLYFSEAVTGAVQSGNHYYLEVSDIDAASLGNEQTVTVDGATYRFSVLSFAKRVVEGEYDVAFQDLMRALVLYAQAAEAL